MCMEIWECEYRIFDTYRLHIQLNNTVGSYEWNNMAQLEADIAEERADLVVHLGDHGGCAQ